VVWVKLFFHFSWVITYYTPRLYEPAAGPEAPKALIISELCMVECHQYPNDKSANQYYKYIHIYYPNTESWQCWHIPLIWNSFNESLSLKESSSTSALQVAQVLVSIDSLRSMPKREVMKASNAGAFSDGCGFQSVIFLLQNIRGNEGESPNWPKNKDLKAKSLRNFF